ncbi:MAG: DUF1080 domain-containing protein [Gemmatimonas sp.]
MAAGSSVHPSPAIDLTAWRMAGQGGFRAHGDAIESYGGPGILWYPDAQFSDFVLRIEWRVARTDDNSGVFLRIPALTDSLQPAIDGGYEVQIDERGIDPERGRADSPLHRTGAIYKLAPAVPGASRPIGAWNRFEITAQGPNVSVRLNDMPVSYLEGGYRRTSGHIGLQAHHAGSAVQFRALAIHEL